MISLDTLCQQPMEISRFLRIAVQASQALSALHREKIVHKDIRPQNFLVDVETCEVTITQRQESSSARSSDSLPGILVAFLPYMAPEQTGRTNDPIDGRTDLYSLGIVFYEMLTGAPPFHADDPVEWIHCHVARVPQPPQEKTKGIPGPVSAIVLKLLAKEPEERYQSVRGLRADLERCLQELESAEHIAPFALGTRDVTNLLKLPRELYGREAESATLREVLERVVTQKVPEVIVVFGASGIGKSSQVRELARLVGPGRGFFIEGKFDQYKQDIPYSTLVQAFRTLVQQILIQGEAHLLGWRQDLQEALGTSGQVIIDIFPHVELIIGPQPPVQALPLNEAQNRFNRVFRQFLEAFTKRGGTLVLFLDDLQWSDLGSIKLLQHILTHPATERILVVGAHRDSEVDASHPWTTTLQDLRKAGVRIHDVHLGPVSLEHTSRFIVDVLRSEQADVVKLASLVHEKTGGNPFFMTQFLTTLHQEELLRFDDAEAVWKFDIDRIRAKNVSDSVVDLIAEKLKRLPAISRDALKLAAHIGSSFDSRTLAQVLDRPEEVAKRALEEALQQGLIQHAAGRYEFFHDRVQQGAYSLLPREQQGEVHLRIGQFMLADTPSSELGAHIFDIANHLNAGAELILERTERLTLAELNLKAGRRAKQSAAYASARAYFVRGMELLPSEAWRDHYPLTFALHQERAECEFLSSDQGTADGLFDMILSHARDSLDKADIYGTRIVLYTTSAHYERAVRVGIEALRTFGVTLPEAREEWARTAQSELQRMRARLDSVSVEAIVVARGTTDALQKAIANLLADMTSSVFNVDHNLLTLINLRIVEISLDHGPSDASTSGYAWLATILATHLGDFEAASRFGKLAIRLVERLNSFQFKARVSNLVGWFVDFWYNPLETSLSYCRAGYRAGLECGDLLYAGYNLMGCDLWLATKATDLDQLRNNLAEHRKLHTQIQHEMAVACSTVLLQSIQSLQGLTNGWGSLSDGSFDEDDYLEKSVKGKLDYAASSYHVLKMQLFAVYEDYSSVLGMAQAYELVKDSSVGSFAGVEYRFFHALALTALHDSFSDEEKAEYEPVLEECGNKLQRWAESCPQNFADKFALVSAELARIGGMDTDTVMHLHAKAIQLAHDNGFVRNEALANEFAARFHLKRGFPRVAAAFLTDARACYARWGAHGKVSQLDEKYAHLLKTGDAPEAGSLYARMDQLDVATMVKASQAVSGEILLDKLLGTLMRIVIEHAGAQRVVLLLVCEGKLSIAATAKTGPQGLVIHVGRATLEAPTVEIAESVVQYVKRTRETLVLNHAAEHGLFTGDAHVSRQKLKSVGCFPIVRQSSLAGLLYLENNLLAGAFTPERLSLLEVLAMQAAISLENASLYAELKELNSELEQRVKDRTVQLEATNKELEAFSYSVSHDLRSPLRTVEGFSLALLEEHGDQLDDQGKDYLVRVRKASLRMGELIDDLLNLARVTRSEMVRTSIDLSALAREIVARLAQAAPQREVTWCIAEGVRADGDRGLLRIVLENLLGNALKFTGKKPRAQIEFGVEERPDGQKVYFVSDDGAGFDMKYADKLFGAFQRMHEAEQFEGTGIGLATVRRITNRHSGEIWAESAIGRGTTIYFTL